MYMCRYTPPVSEVLQWAWVQYMAVFIPVAFMLYRLNGFLLRNKVDRSLPFDNNTSSSCCCSSSSTTTINALRPISWACLLAYLHCINDFFICFHLTFCALLCVYFIADLRSRSYGRRNYEENPLSNKYTYLESMYTYIFLYLCYFLFVGP